MVLKSDQEESTVALKKVVAIVCQAPTVNIESPVRDFQANGNAERAVRTWAAQVRKIQHHLEIRMQYKVPIHFPSHDMASVLGGRGDMSISSSGQWA